MPDTAVSVHAAMLAAQRPRIDSLDLAWPSAYVSQQKMAPDRMTREQDLSSTLLSSYNRDEPYEFEIKRQVRRHWVQHAPLSKEYRTFTRQGRILRAVSRLFPPFFRPSNLQPSKIIDIFKENLKALETFDSDTIPLGNIREDFRLYHSIEEALRPENPKPSNNREAPSEELLKIGSISVKYQDLHKLRELSEDWVNTDKHEPQMWLEGTKSGEAAYARGQEELARFWGNSK
jgi:hypothetical protein